MVEAIRESLARRGARTRLKTNDGEMDCYDCSTLTAQEVLAILRPLAPSLYCSSLRLATLAHMQLDASTAASCMTMPCKVLPLGHGEKMSRDGEGARRDKDWMHPQAPGTHTNRDVPGQSTRGKACQPAAAAG